MVAILDKLEKREKLNFIKKPPLTLEQVREIEKSLLDTAKKQIDMGLGDPTPAVDRAMKSIKSQRVFEQAKQVALKLKKMDFQFVQTPSDEFVRINRLTQVSKLPEFVMIELKPKISSILCRKDGIEYKANIPLIPKAAQELVRRAKEVAPKGKLHILFMPSWEKQPQRDPVLLMEVAKRYVLIASWGSDADVINNKLEVPTHEQAYPA